jgi:hypothetical protein
MVITEGLLMAVVSIIIQHPLNLPYLVMKDDFQSKHLNFTQKSQSANDKILWPGELLICQFRLHISEKPEVRRC